MMSYKSMRFNALLAEFVPEVIFLTNCILCLNSIKVDKISKLSVLVFSSYLLWRTGKAKPVGRGECCTMHVCITIREIQEALSQRERNDPGKTICSLAWDNIHYYKPKSVETYLQLKWSCSNWSDDFLVTHKSIHILQKYVLTFILSFR